MSMQIGSGGGNQFGGNLGIGQNGLDPLGMGQNGQMNPMQLLQQIAQLLGIDPKSGQAQEGGCKGCQGGGKSGGAGGASGGGEANELEELMRKLREMAQNNPQGLMAALNQMPGMAQALSGAMMGSGGGPSGAGMALG